jgi:uncharacterized membrane protein
MFGLVLKAVGGLLIAFGAIWALQGFGLLDWPADSFMLARREWALYGAIAMTVGAALLWLAARLGRKPV